jgi:hypothetical protein
VIFSRSDPRESTEEQFQRLLGEDRGKHGFKCGLGTEVQKNSSRGGPARRSSPIPNCRNIAFRNGPIDVVDEDTKGVGGYLPRIRLQLRSDKKDERRTNNRDYVEQPTQQVSEHGLVWLEELTMIRVMFKFSLPTAWIQSRTDMRLNQEHVGTCKYLTTTEL